MKSTVIFVALLLLSLWVSLNALLLGFYALPGIALQLPSSTAEMGSSFGILNGLFSSFAVILALITVFIQGKEMRASTRAQGEQVKALQAQLEDQRTKTQSQLRQSEAIVEQLKQQQKTNAIHLLQAEHQLHTSEFTRMEALLEKLDVDDRPDSLYSNSKKKKKRHLEKIKKVEKDIDNLR